MARSAVRAVAKKPDVMTYRVRALEFAVPVAVAQSRDFLQLANDIYVWLTTGALTVNSALPPPSRGSRRKAA